MRASTRRQVLATPVQPGWRKIDVVVVSNDPEFLRCLHRVLGIRHRISSFDRCSAILERKVAFPCLIVIDMSALSVSRAAVGRDRPLVATNGIQNGLDIARVMLAGASAAEMSSPVMLRGFELIERSLAELKDYLTRKNIDAQDLIGRAADARKTFAEMPSRRGNWRNYVPPAALNSRD